MEEEIQKAFTKRNLPREIKISIKAGQEKKGEEIVVMDLRNNSSFTDIFLIMHGNSGRQNIALYENIEQKLKKEKVRPMSIEGRKNSDWILMDYGSFIVHIFSQKARQYYSLEKLWGDSPRIEY